MAMTAAALFAQSPEPPPPPEIKDLRPPKPAVRITVESQPTRTGAQRGRLVDVIPKLDPSKLYPLVPGTWEAQVVSGVRKAAVDTIRLNLQDPDLPATVTFPAGDGDILLARWNAADPGRPERATWLWDTPYWDMFIAEVDAVVLRADELTRYCESLLVWDDNPLVLRSLRLTYLNSEPGKQEVSGKGTYIQTQRATYWMHFEALARGDRGYIGVTISKRAIVHGADANFPFDSMFVNERFPPLRERIPGWSREVLLEQLGQGSSRDNQGEYPLRRDAIILEELLSRGPVSDAEVQRILIGGSDRGEALSGAITDSRLSAFLEALESRNELAAYAASIGSALLAGPVQASVKETAMVHVVAAMGKHGIDFSREALSFLERGQYTSSSLFYLGSHAQDVETLRKLERIPVRANFEDDKKRAIQTIRGRLGLPVDAQYR